MRSIGLFPAPFHAFPISIRHHPGQLLHRHPTHEFFLCASGRCWQLTQGGAVANQAGELFFFPAGQDHNSNGHAGHACQALVINFEEDLFAATDEGDAAVRAVLAWLRARALAGDNRVPLSAAGARAAGRAFAELVREAEARRPAHRAAMKLRLAEMLLAVLRDERVLPELRDELRGSPAPERLHVVLRHIAHRYAEPISVERMAALAGLGRSRFHDLFRAATGTTLVDHVAETRVRAAERLLADTDLPIIEIAGACGFPSLSRFYHVFGARRGRTPKATRAAAAG